MPNQYLVIQKNGEILDARIYLDKSEQNLKFRDFVEREAFGENLKVNGDGRSYLHYAQKLGFSWERNADIGLASYDYKANLIVQLVKEYARQLVGQIGFPIYEMSGSNIFDLSHPVVQAYAKLYGDRLFQFQSGKKKLVMSYDASYPQFNLAGKYQLNEKQLPFAHFSISDCYRYEQSGECMLLYRQRRFYMPDLHPYLKDVEEAFLWYPKIELQLIEAAKEFGVEYQVVIEVSSQEHWDQYRSKIVEIAGRLNRDVLIAILDDKKDRYWIINVDYKIIDKFGQAREICCIQIDVGNAKRLEIEYSDSSGAKKNPVIIHSAVPGGIERYIYMAMDDFPNRFPLWLCPSQIRLLPVNEHLVPFCENLLKKYKDLPIRMEVDDRPNSVAKKVALAKQELVPIPVVIGEKEMAMSKIDSLEKAINEVVNKCKGKPFLEACWPKLLSKQIK